MPHWSAITADGQYGMHSLEGTSYLQYLGSVASHGCIRLSPEDATWLYDWVSIGTPVDIVDDYDEPPEAKTIEYRLEKRYCM
jgi:lipoprotein-anchoring transpeptidase ErfK/SrfK